MWKRFLDWLFKDPYQVKRSSVERHALRYEMEGVVDSNGNLWGRSGELLKEGLNGEVG